MPCLSLNYISRQNTKVHNGVLCPPSRSRGVSGGGRPPSFSAAAASVHRDSGTVSRPSSRGPARRRVTAAASLVPIRTPSRSASRAAGPLGLGQTTRRTAGRLSHDRARHPPRLRPAGRVDSRPTEPARPGTELVAAAGAGPRCRAAAQWMAYCDTMAGRGGGGAAQGREAAAERLPRPPRSAPPPRPASFVKFNECTMYNGLGHS